jgi:hypothetical protein
MIFAAYLLAALGVCSLGAKINEYNDALPILDPAPHTTWSDSYGESRKGFIDVPFKDQNYNDDNVHMYRLDLVGDIKQRGYAQGYLLAKEILYFGDVAMSAYYIKAIMNIDISQYPEPLQSILKIVQIKGALAAPEAVNKALQWVYDNELKYMPRFCYYNFYLKM